MSDHLSLPLVSDSDAIAEISRSVYQAILDIQQQQPELLYEKYRTIQWCDTRYQSAISNKLNTALKEIQDWNPRLVKVRRLLQSIFIPNYFNTPEFKELLVKIRALIPHKTQSVSDGLLSAEPTQSTISLSRVANPSPGGIAILLLDVENLQLDIETEQFIAGICTYPIQIKVAFANWRSMGKKDIEFHSRGYELIHVPPGKDSADVKMATVGSSIFVHYPTAREVLVCSSDGVMTHLYNTLQTHGLTVYLVRRQGDTITVLNSKTNQTQTHSLNAPSAIPSVEQFITQLKDIIKDEQNRTGNPWIKLSIISTRFQTQYKITISQIVANHFPGKRARDIFIDYPNEFVIHQLSDKSELYVTIFDIEHPGTSGIEPNTTDVRIPQTPDPPLLPFKSKVELEHALIKIVKTLTANSSQKSVPISNIGTEFHKQYNQPITKVIKTLNLEIKFPQFLQACSGLKLNKSGNAYQVTFDSLNSNEATKIKPTNQKENESSINLITSVEELEKIIAEMIIKLSKASNTNDVSVNLIKKEFLDQYKITADASVKKFQPDSSLIKFLRSPLALRFAQSRPTLFKLTLVNKDYRVAIIHP
ncbi:MAG TPA: NYN domain-containing protein [Cyanobacteria bacterium UBA12227]|nr:NYN domain-containing protein [Cyanobacteria bacterium UBA12227]HAX84889.1 NYN domain-containing protein [Cyanobacteria bacterium UBA11370]